MINLSFDFFAYYNRAEKVNDNKALKQERKAFQPIFQNLFAGSVFLRQFFYRVKSTADAVYTGMSKLPIHNGALRLLIERIENEWIVGNPLKHIFTLRILKNFFARRCRYAGIKGRE